LQSSVGIINVLGKVAQVIFDVNAFARKGKPLKSTVPTNAE